MLCVDRFLWKIPLTYKTSHSNTIQRFLLENKTGENPVTFEVNAQPISYCATKPRLIQSLSTQLNLLNELIIVILETHLTTTTKKTNKVN